MSKQLTKALDAAQQLYGALDIPPDRKLAQLKVLHDEVDLMIRVEEERQGVVKGETGR